MEWALEDDTWEIGASAIRWENSIRNPIEPSGRPSLILLPVGAPLRYALGSDSSTL